jgi:hypothetical protein
VPLVTQTSEAQTKNLIYKRKLSKVESLRLIDGLFNEAFVATNKFLSRVAFIEQQRVKCFVS